MKQLYVCLFATLATSAFAGVTVTSPTNGAQVTSPVHYVATAQSPDCSKGVAAMGIYTAPYQLVYTVNGSKLDTYLTLSAGTYNTVVQEWDNCVGEYAGHNYCGLRRRRWWNLLESAIQ